MRTRLKETGPFAGRQPTRPGRVVAVCGGIGVLLLAGCDMSHEGSAVLRLASTTSARDSGLLDLLLPAFEQAHDCRVDLLAVGSGAALKLGQAGDVDAVLCHSRAAEESFIRSGYGVRHEPIMHNYFVIAGPAEDPAGVKGCEPVEALRKVAESDHRFVSRGDHSGTHLRELSLWQQVGRRPGRDAYVEAGSGMGPTLMMADEMNAYVLTDEGTWYRHSRELGIVPLVTESMRLKNPYALLVVNPDRHPAVNETLAQAFADFLISEPAQTMIAEYQIQGRSLFRPERLVKEVAE